jgi:hypothetical protein
VFTLLLQEKEFLEGTTLPPIMIYWGPTELPEKKESKHILKSLEQAQFSPPDIQFIYAY